jgi:hypothetical protein
VVGFLTAEGNNEPLLPAVFDTDVLINAWQGSIYDRALIKRHLAFITPEVYEEFITNAKGGELVGQQRHAMLADLNVIAFDPPTRGSQKWNEIVAVANGGDPSKGAGEASVAATAGTMMFFGYTYDQRAAKRIRNMYSFVDVPLILLEHNPYVNT